MTPEEAIASIDRMGRERAAFMAGLKADEIMFAQWVLFMDRLSQKGDSTISFYDRTVATVVKTETGISVEWIDINEDVRLACESILVMAE